MVQYSGVLSFFRLCCFSSIFSIAITLVHPQISTNRNLTKLWYASQGQLLVSVVNILYLFV